MNGTRSTIGVEGDVGTLHMPYEIIDLSIPLLSDVRLTFSGKVGFEAEVLILDEGGRVVDQADLLVSECRSLSETEAKNQDFRLEFTHAVLEVGVKPGRDFLRVARDFVVNLSVAVQAARNNHLWLYAAGTYPIAFTTKMRRAERYKEQELVIGSSLFAKAKECFGFHFHAGLPPGLFDCQRAELQDVASSADKHTLVAYYNLLTALEPALAALLQSSPFYRGKHIFNCSRIPVYRGSRVFNWPGVYQKLPLCGDLLSYVADFDDLVKRNREASRVWRGILSNKLSKSSESNGNLSHLGRSASWNPVRISGFGTIEQRGMDMNMPTLLIAAGAIIAYSLEQVRQNRLKVGFHESGILTTARDTVLVPVFEILYNELWPRAVRYGLKDALVQQYCSSVLAFAQTAGGQLRKLFEPFCRMIETQTTVSDSILLALQSFWSPLNEQTPSEAHGRSLALELSKAFHREVLQLAYNSRLRSSY